MRAGSTISAAWARSTEVASTAPGQSRSISPRISSSPGASGKGGLPGLFSQPFDRAARFLVGPGRRGAGFRAGAAARPLLGAVGLVAATPALVGVTHDLALQLDEAVEDGLRAGRAAGHVDVD